MTPNPSVYIPNPQYRKQYYSYVWVGNIYDKLWTEYIDFKPKVDDHRYTKEEWQGFTKIVAAHELGHNIFQDFTDPSYLHDCPYGLMVENPIDYDMRSYLYEYHIYWFRQYLDFDSQDQ
jgi:hypothetical protein